MLVNRWKNCDKHTDRRKTKGLTCGVGSRTMLWLVGFPGFTESFLSDVDPTPFILGTLSELDLTSPTLATFWPVTSNPLDLIEAALMVREG